MTFFLRSLSAGACVAGLWLGAAAGAAELPKPAGALLLTVGGRIENPNAGDVAVFDRAMLEALPAVTFETETIWTEGPQRFTGVSLHALLDAVGATGSVLAATAINDYSVEIPVSDAVPGGPIIAYRLNGEEMPVREKGPLWIVYPYDDVRDYRTEVIYSRSIWQLDSIVVND